LSSGGARSNAHLDTPASAREMSSARRVNFAEEPSRGSSHGRVEVTAWERVAAPPRSSVL
jgi:hypothetical protein